MGGRITVSATLAMLIAGNRASQQPRHALRCLIVVRLQGPDVVGFVESNGAQWCVVKMPVVHITRTKRHCAPMVVAGFGAVMVQRHENQDKAAR